MKKISLVALLLHFSLSALAESPLKKCEAHDESLNSKFLSKEVPYRVFLPKGYDASKKYGVVYFLHGRGADHRMLDTLNFCSALDSAMESGTRGFIVVAPSGGDNYWMNGAKTGEKWGDMVSRELLSQVESRYPILSSPKGRLISGISMGGHGAIQLSLNNPGLFGAVAGHSPVFRTEEEAQRDFANQFGTGKQYADRDPVSLMTKKRKKLAIPIWVDIGDTDPWLRQALNFGKILKKFNADATLSLGNNLSGGHNLEYWRYRLPEYIQWYSKHLNWSNDTSIHCP